METTIEIQEPASSVAALLHEATRALSAVGVDSPRLNAEVLLAKAAGLGPLIREKTGLVPDAYFSGTKIAWILDHVPGARVRAAGAGTAGTILWPLWSHTKLRQIALDFLPQKVGLVRQFARRSENCRGNLPGFHSAVRDIGDIFGDVTGPFRRSDGVARDFLRNGILLTHGH